jgi:hypothetical protein
MLPFTKFYNYKASVAASLRGVFRISTYSILPNSLKTYSRKL